MIEEIKQHPTQWIGKGEPKHPAVDELTNALKIINEQRQRIQQLEAQLAERDKQNAAMREAYRKWLEWLDSYGYPDSSEDVVNAIEKAFTGDHNTDYIHRSEVEPLVEFAEAFKKWQMTSDAPHSQWNGLLYSLDNVLAHWRTLKEQRGWK